MGLVRAVGFDFWGQLDGMGFVGVVGWDLWMQLSVICGDSWMQFVGAVGFDCRCSWMGLVSQLDGICEPGSWIGFVGAV